MTPTPEAIAVLAYSRDEARKSAKQYANNEEHYLGLRDQQRAIRLRLEAKVDELSTAIARLEAVPA